MGWKTVKEHYGIKHIVQVYRSKKYGDEPVIAIGSGYSYDSISIRISDGKIFKRFDGITNELLDELQPRLDADEKSGKLKELIDAEDHFERLLPVYYIGDNKHIQLKWCEHYGYPNVTTDGMLMCENEFYSKIKAAKYHLMQATRFRWSDVWHFVNNRLSEIGSQIKGLFKYDLHSMDIWRYLYVRCFGVWFIKK